MTAQTERRFFKFGSSRFDLEEFFGFKAWHDNGYSSPYRIYLYKKGNFSRASDCTIKLGYISSKKESWEKIVEMLDSYFNVSDEILKL